MYLTGAAQIDITPDWPVDLCGFVAREQPSTGIHDRLYARALYLEGGGKRLLWLHADLLGFPGFYADYIKSLLHECDGLEEHEVMISATHTHSGPATLPLFECGEIDPKYLSLDDCLLTRQLLAVSEAAMRDTEPTRAWHCEGKSDLCIDRRGFSTAHVDPIVGVVGFRREDGSYKAVIANYAVHLVAMGGANRMISADMFGAASRAIQGALPGVPVVLFTAGACGNLNPPEVGDDFPQMERWGGGLGDIVVASLKGAEAVADGLSSSLIRQTVPFPTLTPTTAKEFADRLRLEVEGNESPTANRIRKACDRWEAKRENQPNSLTVPIQTINIGGIRFVGIGGEIFSIVTPLLRRHFGTPTYTVSYANDVIAYFAPSAAYLEGGYELESAPIFFGTPPIPMYTIESMMLASTRA